MSVKTIGNSRNNTLMKRNITSNPVFDPSLILSSSVLSAGERVTTNSFMHYTFRHI